MTTHEVLVAARNVFDKRGHWKAGDYSTAAGLCPILAIKESGGDRETRRDARRVLEGTLRLFDIPEWNDAPERTKEEVLALFDEAIVATAPSPDVSFLTREAVRV